ncbi:MAG: hypothetical protein AB1555_07755 [Nitrospirota bacterium]
MDNTLTILNVSGPYREPREPAFSYDYAIQRPTWPSPFGVRVKISIADELDYVKGKLLGQVTGSPGQQLLLNQVLTRRIADQKLRIADQEGMLSERQDVLIGPFTGPLNHLFPRLDAWLNDEQAALRAEIRQRVRL